MSVKKSKKFLYENVRERLIQLIQEREMSPQDILPSESDIADLCSVSKMTAKLALNRLEEEGVIYRLARRGSFLSNDFKEKIDRIQNSDPVSEKMLSGDRFMALLVPFVDSYVSKILTAIINEAEILGWNIILRVTEDSEKEDQLLRELSQMKKVQGIILFPYNTEMCGSELLRLNLEKFPVVVIDRTYKEVSFDSISHDNYHGAYEIIRYLIDKGHRNIGFLSILLQTAKSRKDRYQGYLHSLIENNVAIRNRQILYLEEICYSELEIHVLNSPHKTILDEYLRDNKELTSVFCSDDYVAVELYYAAERAGLRVPEDLSIVGFSDNRILKFLPIMMTTVAQPVDEMARQAVSLLENRINNPEEKIHDIKLTTLIVERSSVKTLKQSDIEHAYQEY